jgi:uncharacterized protein (DUF983 family)
MDGACNDCGEPIGYNRLMAYPTAKRCVQCQEVYEKTHAGNLHPKLCVCIRSTAPMNARAVVADWYSRVTDNRHRLVYSVTL